MEKYHLFVDGSVNTGTKEGFGSFFITDDLNCKDTEIDIQQKKFTETSSTKLELENLLWALESSELEGKDVFVYTDSQNIIGLLDRRDRLESKGFKNGKGELLNNYLLYQTFYEKTDTLNLTFVKVKGHKASKKKNQIDWLFSKIDKASRQALRTND